MRSSSGMGAATRERPHLSGTGTGAAASCALQVRVLLVVALLPTLISSLPVYQNSIPNGDKVIDPSGNAWPGVGHARSSGGGSLNPFGIDFKAADYKWTQDLCRKDSDCDGLSNGEELGDPLCQWSEGSGELPQFDVGITHPGIADVERSTVASAGGLLDTCSDFAVGDLPSDHVSTSFIMPSYEVPSERTTYAKYAIQIDDVEDMYAVRFDPVIDQTQLVHHILLYHCSSKPDASLFQQPTTEEFMPCDNLVFAWAVGGSSFCLPPKLGFEFPAASPWYLIDVHYDNPNGRSGVKDNSGIQVTRFPQSSVLDNSYQSAAYLWVGAEIDAVTVPPLRPVYEVTAECTFDDMNIPDTGITVFSYFLHGHQIARKIWTEVQRPKFDCPSFCVNNPVCRKCFSADGCCGSRDGSICFEGEEAQGRCCDQCDQCEICERCYEKTSCNPGGGSYESFSFDLGCNTRYDFDLQETVPLQQFQKVYANDVLTTHCVYDSSERTSITYGGDATDDEMCIAFFLFYPSSPATSSAARCLTRENTKLGVGDGVHTCNVPGQVGYDDSSCGRGSEHTIEYNGFQDLSKWLQVHIITMYIAWGFVLPLGVLIPMSFRGAFQDESKWFQLHRIMQVTGTLLLLIGCSAAFANVTMHFRGTHQKLGLSVFVLALLQVLIAVFRPHNLSFNGVVSKSRQIWTVLHKGLGRIVIVMAWSNVILGAKLIEEWYSTSPILTKALVGLQGAIIVMLTLVVVWRWRYTAKQKESKEVSNPPDDLNLKPIA